MSVIRLYNCQIGQNVPKFKRFHKKIDQTAVFKSNLSNRTKILLDNVTSRLSGNVT